jgi:hypothetical protein
VNGCVFGKELCTIMVSSVVGFDFGQGIMIDYRMYVVKCGDHGL